MNPRRARRVGVHAGAFPDGSPGVEPVPHFWVRSRISSELMVGCGHKGDAVLIVATEGSAAGGTAITLLSGVEPILQAAPSASQAMMLTPWSLGGAPSGDAQ